MDRSKITDEELVAIFQSGDNSAFTLLVSRYKKVSKSLAATFIKEYGYMAKIDYEDLYSIGLSSLLLAANGFNNEYQSLYKYYLTVAKNEMLKHIVENLQFYNSNSTLFYLGNVDELEGNIASSDNVINDVSINDAFAILDKELHSSNFKEDYVRIFELYYFYQMSIEEIAKIYNKKPATIRRRIRVIKESLSNILFNSKE